MADQVFITIMGGEAKSPRLSIARAAKTVPVRVATIYLLTITFSSILVSPDDPRLFGGSATSQSPFTIAMNDAGIYGVDQFLRVLILLSCFGFGAEAVYIASRILRALSHQKLIPEFIAAKVDSRGRPVWSLAITGVVSIALTYINLSGKWQKLNSNTRTFADAEAKERGRQFLLGLRPSPRRPFSSCGLLSPSHPFDFTQP